MQFAAERLQRWTESVLAACQVPARAAAATAHQLIRSSLRGIDTHGVARVPAYTGFLRDGTVDPAASPAVSERHGALHCDADRGLGQYAVAVALEAAMAKARTQTIVGCTIDNCGHLGALGTSLIDAAQQGMVGILCQRTPPIMAMPGFSGRAIGNNPLAFAMPVAGGPPVVFDIAMSAVARGNVADAARDGKPAIPEGWAVDEHGQPTTDTQAALRGAMLPAAGHKGLGLAMIVQCLAGSLGGAAPDPAPGAPTDAARGTGAFLLVANPDLLAGRQAFDASVAQWLGTYRRAAAGTGRYPGERQARCEQERLATGIPVTAGLLAELEQVGKLAGVPLPV